MRNSALLVAAALCLLVSACARPQASVHAQPEYLPAGIEWVQTVSSAQDAGIANGFWRRLVDLVAGGRDTGIVKPYGVFHHQGRLVVVDSGRGVAHLMHQKSNRYSLIGGKAEQPLLMPIAITGDDNGNLYITDSAAGVVYRHSPAGQLVSFASLQRPTGIAFNPKNRHLYVTDTLAHQVVVFDLAGVERGRIGRRGTAPGMLNYPTDLFIDKRGSLYVTDPLNFRVQVFSAEGVHLRTIGDMATFSKPKGVAVDSAGNIYVCDSLLDVVKVFDRTGASLVDFGGRGFNAGEFWMPAGIYIDEWDTIFVADAYNRRIQIFRYTGEG